MAGNMKTRKPVADSRKHDMEVAKRVGGELLETLVFKVLEYLTVDKCKKVSHQTSTIYSKLRMKNAIFIILMGSDR